MYYILYASPKRLVRVWALEPSLRIPQARTGSKQPRRGETGFRLEVGGPPAMAVVVGNPHWSRERPVVSAEQCWRSVIRETSIPRKEERRLRNCAGGRGGERRTRTKITNHGMEIAHEAIYYSHTLPSNDEPQHRLRSRQVRTVTQLVRLVPFSAPKPGRPLPNTEA